MEHHVGRMQLLTRNNVVHNLIQSLPAIIAVIVNYICTYLHLLIKLIIFD